MASGAKTEGMILRKDLTKIVNELSYEDLNLVGERLAGTIPVARDSGKWPVLPRETKAKLYDTARHSEGGFTEISWVWDADTYVTHPYGLLGEVDMIANQINEEFIDMERTTVLATAEQVKIARDYRIMDAFFNTTRWDGSNDNVSATAVWTTAASAKVKTDVEKAARKVWQKSFLSKRQLSVVMSDDALEAALASDAVTANSKYVVNLEITPIDVKARLLAQYLGVKEVIPCDASFDASGIGADASAKRTASGAVVWVGLLNRGGSLTSPGGVCNLRYTGFPDLAVFTFPDHKLMKEYVRVFEYRGVKIRLDYGCQITGCLTVESATNRPA